MVEPPPRMQQPADGTTATHNHQTTYRCSCTSTWWSTARCATRVRRHNLFHFIRNAPHPQILMGARLTGPLLVCSSSLFLLSYPPTIHSGLPLRHERISDFRSREEMVETCMASIHIPLFLDGRPFMRLGDRGACVCLFHDGCVFSVGWGWTDSL